ncbi:MAG: ABC transporter permease [Candidatus Krumholzibacteria bacterium]|nr:ABC transporter permease [Candidatus Krumholzibacteria bacterium]
MKGVLHLVRKELRQVFRDPMMLRIVFLMPILQLFILGYAVTFDVKNVALLMIDRDATSASRGLVDRFAHNEHFVVKRIADPGKGIEGYLRRGEAVLAVVIPKHFGRSLETGKPTEVEILLDGQNSNTAGIALGYCSRILYRFASDRATEGFARSPSISRAMRFIEPETRIWYNPELKSVYFMIPGIIAILLTIITMLLTGLAIVKERESGTLEQLLVTPLKPWQIIAGKTIPFAMLGIAEMALATTVGVLWFHIPIVGNVALLALLAFTFILATLGLGVLISTLAGTQQQALFITWFFLQIFILLSGLFYPIENMPRAVQMITVINPLRYFIAINREIFLKGGGLGVLWPELRALLIIGVCVFGFATLRFHKRAS